MFALWLLWRWDVPLNSIRHINNTVLYTVTFIFHSLLLLSYTLSFSFCLFLFLQSMAASTFKDFDLASTQQRPDSVLRRRRRQKQAALESAAAASSAVAQPSAARRFVRLAVMGLTVALGAAALAVVNTALEWAPKLDLFPWTAPTPPLTSLSLAESSWWVCYQEPFN